MKSTTILLVLSASLLGACAEESSTTSTGQAQQPVADNPLAIVPPGTSTPTPTEPAPSVPVSPEAPPVQVPVNDQPGSLPVPSLPSFPVLMPVQGVGAPAGPVSSPPSEDPVSNPAEPVSTAQLINGNSAGTAQTFWQCGAPGSVDLDNTFAVSFFADSTALLAAGGESILVDWNVSGSGVLLTEPNNPDSIGLGNIGFVSVSQFQANLIVTGVGSAPIECNQFSTDGSPVTPVAEGPSAPGDQPPVPGQPTIINPLGDDGLENYWMCQLSSGEEVLLFFAQNGAGGLISFDFPEGIEFSWSSNSQGVSILLVDGNQVILTTPEFDGADSFFVDNVLANGADNGAMFCDLVSA